MDEDSVFTKRFIDCVKKPHQERTEQDLDFICHTLEKLSEFHDYNASKLKTVPENLIYEVHSKDYILYSTDDKATSWYYVLTGSVMLSMLYFFSTGSSFGRCVNSDIRNDQCHVLEKTELLRINYTEEELKYFAQRAAKMASRNHVIGDHDNQLHNGVTSSHGSSTKAETTITPVQNHNCCERPSIENMAGVTINSNSSTSSSSVGDVVVRRRPLQVTSSESTISTRTATLPNNSISDYPRSADLLERNRRSRSEERIIFSFDPADVKSMSNENLDKPPDRSSPLSHQRPISSTEMILQRTLSDMNPERRYSAPPGEGGGGGGGGGGKHMRDSMGSMDYLSEGPDSDDEESVQSESSSATSMDAVLEVLSKQPSERSQEDIDRVMDVLQYMVVFSNMTSNIRRALFQVLMVLTVENENTVVIENGEDVDRWYVVLNGQFKLVREAEVEKNYSIGDSFGVSQSLKVLPQRGRLISADKACTLCYVSADDFGRVRTQGEENLKKIYQDEEMVAVLEKRSVERKEGYFIIQGTPEKLLEELVHESVDDTFVQDFLLTYRTFLKSPLPIIEKLKAVWTSEDPNQRERINTVVQRWVADHFSDFEGQDKMEEFLDWFEQELINNDKKEEKKRLDKSRTSNSSTRNVELDRAGTNSPLEFEVIGGWEHSQPIFVHKVESGSNAREAGLRVGDQILEINDSKCDKKELKFVISILKKNYKLSLKVRSNLPEYKLFMAEPKAPVDDHKDHKLKTPRPPPLVAHMPLAHALSVDTRPSSARTTGTTSKEMESSPKAKKKLPRIYKPLTAIGGRIDNQLRKMHLRAGKSISLASLGSDNTDTVHGPLKAKGKMSVRKSSTENLLDNDRPASLVRASSMEDMHALSKQSSGESSSGSNSMASKIVDAVVKVYQPDHTHKYIDITATTAIAELIQKGVKEFYPEKFVVTPADEYCICMVTVTSRNGPIRNSVLPNHMSDLANYIGIESRYYLKERAFHGTLVQDEEAEHIFKESRQWENLLNLKPKQIAEELTRQDSSVFCSIDTSEYIADLWRNPNQLARENLKKFENIPNDEMYWVVTMVVSETRSEIRAKIIKHFIKVGKWCKELRNFNSVFHIISGLNHGLVQRQKVTWEKVPHKHKKVFEDISSYMNPFHNMAKYRELQRTTAPPLIPFFPIIKKDLTFLYDGNETQVGGLVNFEKLRMLSQQIRTVKNFCLRTIMPEPPQIDMNRLGGVLKTLHHSIRMRNRHAPHAMATLTDNALKEVFNHHRMMKMVRKHLSQKYVVQEEDLLERIAESSEKVIQMRKNPPSPLHRAKRKSGPPDKLKAINYSISPSSTTASFGSDTSAQVVDSSLLFTPPISPRRTPGPALTNLTSDSTSLSTSLPTANGLVPVSQ